ncbi:hypothetical protein C8J57DRAFT_1237683 [Mycena rebaudengoi]|nr:hypothetical protein C8J57DRAFT_1237683 [Mycena rebaudengoi]
MREIFDSYNPDEPFPGYNGGGLANETPEAVSCLYGGASGRVFDVYKTSVVMQDIIFKMANKNGEVYAPNYSVAISAEDEIVPASVVFEFEHPEFSPTNRIFREVTPPSPFTPGTRFRRPAPTIELQHKQDAVPCPVEVVDLTMDDDEEEVQEVVTILRPKREPKDTSFNISPCKKVKYS